MNTAFKVLFLLKIVRRNLFAPQAVLHKNVVFITAHGAVEVVALAFALAVFLPVARGAKHHIHIKGVRPHYGRNGIVKIAVLGTQRLGQRGRNTV